jgi:hypothetical protein
MTIADISDSRARRAAKRFGLCARKSRWRQGTVDNRGGYMLIDPLTNYVAAGEKLDLTAADVIEYCHEAVLSAA